MNAILKLGAKFDDGSVALGAALLACTPTVAVEIDKSAGIVYDVNINTFSSTGC